MQIAGERQLRKIQTTDAVGIYIFASTYEQYF